MRVERDGTTGARVLLLLGSRGLYRGGRGRGSSIIGRGRKCALFSRPARSPHCRVVVSFFSTPSLPPAPPISATTEHHHPAMSSVKLHPHPSLPAPVVHASVALQSKSHVLTGVQDAYWSDEEEAKECPLCLEEMDISDLNFKPCMCGYQICRFCWHHIKRNINNKCPACRRDYADEIVQFKPVNKEDQRRLTQQKKQRERERKDLDLLGRRHLANIVLVKRTPPGSQTPVVGLYITYHRREDAGRCIAAVDGSASPGGGNEVMRASYGTTKYCMSFLRGVNCPDHNCMNLHEWGDEKDCFTKEDLATLQHAIKDMEVTRKTVVLGKKADDSTARLPRSASWAKTSHDRASTATALHNNTNTSATVTAARTTRRGERTARPRATTPAGGDATKEPVNGTQPTKASSVASSSRPSTPATGIRPATPSKGRSAKQKVAAPPPVPPRSPTSSIAIDSDAGSGSQDALTSSASPEPTTPAIPPGLPAVPPGLSAPPGLPPPGSRPSQSTQSYQMSTQVQALLNDVKARRESALPTTGISPFPDFDRTLQTLSEVDGKFGGFSFNLDPKLAEAEDMDAPDLSTSEANTPFHGSFIDAFPGLRSSTLSSPNTNMGPPGLAYQHNPARAIYDPMAIRNSPIPSQPSPSTSYTGSFNPFAENGDSDSAAAARRLALDDDPSRKMSRFGFARGGRQGGGNLSSTSSPLITSTPLSPSDSLGQGAMYSNDMASPSSQWSAYPHPQFPNTSATSSPLVPQAQAQAQAQAYSQLAAAQAGRFQPFDQASGVSEAALREFIQSSRDQRTNISRVNAAPLADQEHAAQYRYAANQHFNDPAIMSASFASPMPNDARFSNAPATLEAYPPNPHQYGPPPGLSYPPPGLSPSPQNNMGGNVDLASNEPSFRSTAPSPSPLLSSSDFPALTAQPPQLSTIATSERLQEQAGEVDGDKAVRKAAKKAAAAERAAERLRASTEKKAERERERLEKRAKLGKEREEKDRVKREKEEQVRVRREEQAKIELENTLKAKLELEKVELALKQVKEVTAVAAKSAIVQKPVEEPAAMPAPPRKATRQPSSAKLTPAPIVTAPEVVSQGPLLSKMPKKNRPVAKPIRIPKEDESPAEPSSVIPSAATSEAPASERAGGGGESIVDTNSSSSRGQSLERTTYEPTSVEELLAQIAIQNPAMNLSSHPFFDITKINPTAKMPLEYGPLVHALSALSVGGGSFANSMPSGSIDNAVSSFQQLLETLTQTISDLLRLLPRTTWDDSSSFDGVLRDMLKGDDFLDENGEEGVGKDEVAALTLALERRARWMEVQLSKLEELHRDINTAAVRAVLSFNDNGWDPHGFAPRMGNTLQKFDTLGMTAENGAMRLMTVDELEKKLSVAKEAAVFAEVELKEVMGKMQWVPVQY
ncbi:hypothetical protein BV25DRAFT_1169580 [Artomyces pyxidatus]|uniref:Uncharacterized protein n=1 Tax=Artomyces pyxidatus TaxID=48021 RepID=A0ACB8STC6_9AGAM|nr:hypothetical protein BV25DRAFT_1169580 [Artomyces pyxidatus]